ncbi:hypothetical protein OBBRIDRAFT_810929 [Obba rivulosa]|uniref:P-loop containing nucleoside triphosphate hydrolase protein n=1 Tax=Obba rivulosa TaxID=1052685 RepID=A0A8E2J379_9APHY|nr:hypothetical protein OBBRIDRAFT_810929 [Obba rivulosa]
MGVVRPLGDLVSSLQVVLSPEVLRTQVSDASVFPKEQYTWKNSLVLPAAVASISVALLLLHLLVLLLSRFVPKAVSLDGTSSRLIVAAENGHYSQPRVTRFRVARLLCVVALLALSILTVISPGIRDVHSAANNSSIWLDISLCGVYAYLSLLSLASVLAGQRLNRIVRLHLATVLAVTWGVYVYRDVWPLATFTLTPLDAGEGRMLWMKLILLTVAGAVIPLTAPRQYIPLDPDNPKEPNPEQTASILSVALYFHLDPVVFKAYRTRHLKLDELPPTADYDVVKSLIKKSYPHLDPFEVKKDRHLFWGLLRVFCNYLETGGEGAVVRPWVWISWLFFGPALSSAALQWHIFISTRIAVRVQAIIISLVFDHSLRIRVKAEDDKSPGASAEPRAVTTPDTTSVEESTEGRSTDSQTANEGDTIRANSVGADSSSKNKPKTKSKVEKPTAAAGEKAKNIVGKLNNLATLDVNNITNARDFLALFIMGPMQTGVSIWFLYSVLGWSSFVGLATMLALFPIPGYITSLTQQVQREKMKRTDARVQAVTETLNVIRMIKLFGWESRATDQIGEKRQDELLWQKKYQILSLSINIMNYMIPLVIMLTTFFTYIFSSMAGAHIDRYLTRPSAYVFLSVFDLLRKSWSQTTAMIPSVVQGKVSLERVADFLRKAELLDEFAAIRDGESLAPAGEVPAAVIGFRKATFTWANEGNGTFTPGTQRHKFTLRVEEELVFKRGHFNLIVGPTGSGKTSLLMALLGEMHYIPAGPDSYVSLPRSGGVAYAAQESWVQNETIKENILFGSPYDEERYDKVVTQCALQRDLSLFGAGDQTEVGEKGLTLSASSFITFQARITLARAIYSSAEILLLDDVLAALDVHTAKWIVDKCFKGDLLRGRTVILVTHNVAIASPIAELVVSLGTDGRIASVGSLDSALAKNKKLSKEVQEEKEEIKKAENEDKVESDVPARTSSDGKLVVEEEIAMGHVGWAAMKLYLKALGGRYPVLFWIGCVGGIFMTNLIITIQVWFLGYWAQQYEEHDPKDVHVAYYLTIYSALLLLVTAMFSSSWITWVLGGLRASRQIHQELITSILGTTLRWLDKTPISRIIARCTQDVGAIDSTVQMYMFRIIDQTLDMSIRFFAVVAFSPIFFIPGAIIAGAGGICGQIYMKAQPPVLGHFGAAIAGLTSIRAYGAQELFRKESLKRIDHYTRAAVPFYDLARWVSIRLDALGGLFVTSLAIYLIYFTNTRPSNIGFALNMAAGFAGMIFWWIRIMNELELSGGTYALYIEVEHEPKPTSDGIPPAYWPSSGKLTVVNLSARYSADGPRVLHEISFEIGSGERVGIVGRTGSGKSSLTLALLRCIITEGNVYYDGLLTDSMNLNTLRSNITIIPQVPELLSGTLRQNLDPFGQHDDAVLNDALRAAGLFSLQSEDDEGRIALDSEIATGGGNFSVGQRQIIALARAIVRQSKLLILDEDHATDAVIQQSLRNELGKDVTLLTIAHRLQTIMDADKIMVLDEGRIVEFDKPSELLKNPKGMLRALVEESGDKESLYNMAQQTNRQECTLARAHEQLQAQEDKSKKKRTKVFGDGLPKLLTGDEFFRQVQEFEQRVADEELQKAQRKASRVTHAAMLVAWKTQNKERKARNDARRAEYQATVKVWELEREQAKLEKRKTRWNKPKMWKLEPAVPRPKRVVEDEDEVEDSSSDDGVEG